MPHFLIVFDSLPIQFLNFAIVSVAVTDENAVPLRHKNGRLVLEMDDCSLFIFVASFPAPFPNVYK